MGATVKFAQVPKCLQFNEFILYGYGVQPSLPGELSGLSLSSRKGCLSPMQVPSTTHVHGLLAVVAAASQRDGCAP
jgi:hypothetical protein